MVLPGGMKEGTLSFDDIPIVAERFFPPEHIGFIDVNTWYHCIDKDVEWIRGLDGSVLHFGAVTSDVFTAVLRTYRNFACLYPAANGYVFGLEE
jgi:glycogen synthase